MKQDIKIGVIGGDTRLLATAHSLARDGFRVNCYGVPKIKGKYNGYKICNTLNITLKDFFDSGLFNKDNIKPPFKNVKSGFI